MPHGADQTEKRKINPIADLLASKGFYHSFLLPDGTVIEGAMPMAVQRERWNSFGLPEDLTGKRALDIGPWDGFFTYELARRGADVVAIDYVDLDSFRRIGTLMGAKVDYQYRDVYNLSPKENGHFDIVLFLGVLYHLKHPLLALERVCAITRDVCIVDTFVVDAEARAAGRSDASLPYIEFYERDEFAGQLDNWCGPTVSAVEAMVRAAGFCEARLLALTSTTARVAGFRKWQHLPAEVTPAVRVFGLTSHRYSSRCFRSDWEEYILVRIEWHAAEPPAIDSVFVNIDGLGSPLLSRNKVADGSLQLSLRLPPGLEPGKHQLTVKIGDSHWSAPTHFYVDLPDLETGINLRAVQNSVTWEQGQTSWDQGGWITLWMEGLSPEADAGNTVVWIAGVPHRPNAVDAEKQQINLQLRAVINPGPTQVQVTHRGTTSSPLPLAVQGTPPPIHTLPPQSPT